MSLPGNCRTRSCSTQQRQVTCSVHLGRPCQPCILCKQGNQSKYFHPKSWKDKTLLEHLRKCEPSTDIQPDSCICRLCRDDVSKTRNDGFIPRWKKLPKKQEHTCCYILECTRVVYKTTKLVSKASFCDIFGENAEPISDEGIALCLEHYGELYRHLNPFNKTCITCDKAINDISKSRKCPEPELIQLFLQQNTKFSGVINADSRVCYACYKAHLIIIKHKQNTITSTDADLSSSINKIKSEMCNISDIHTPDEALSNAAHFSGIHVGEALLKHNALLLPDVYDIFLDKLTEITRVCSIVLEDVKSTASPSWLRNQLSTLLEHHMAYRCSVKKYGTVLYRYGGDLVHALNVSLGQARSQSQKVPAMGESDSCTINQTSLSETCTSLNAKCHACIQKMIKEDTTNPHTIEDIDIDKFIDKLDPDIWKAVCLLTQPLSSQAIKNAGNSHVRKVRRLFCVCTLLFTTNSQCSFPLHTLIADAIETCGGSLRLMRLLNRLGACVSADTHSRYLQYRVQKSEEEGPMPENAFTIASADNLDFIHSHARVYCGKQQSSWHGTTLQLVQPQPSTLVYISQEAQEREIATHAEATNATSDSPMDSTRHPDSPAFGTLETRYQACLSIKRSYSTRSPTSSPSKCLPLPKRQRRMRTGIEQSCRNLHDEMASASTTDREYRRPTQSQKPKLTIINFQLNGKEDKTLRELRELSTHYILQKVASNQHDNITLIDFQTYFSLAYNIPTPECSNIIYLKVLDQRCDDKETLLNVISELYEEFIVPKRTEWVLLEGDQATYQRLQCIKAEYGKDLAWMVPFPGDWHILKNFQEVLLKVYFDAGLSDLAKASGYNPNSIGTNFKRTHRFLLESWESLYRHFFSLFLANEAPSDFLNCASEWVKSFPTSQDQTSALRNLKQMLDDLSDKYQNFQQHFNKFMEMQASVNKTWKFWTQFVFQDCFAYVSLYLAMRSGRWELRMAAIKSMAALFTAFDRPNYQRLIPQHIVDMLTIPREILSHLSHGGFTVSIRGRPCHSVGIDEAHEMCINKECKEYITKPSGDYINRTAMFLPVRAKAIKHIEDQLFPEHRKPDTIPITSINAYDRESKKLEMNVRSQTVKLKNNSNLTNSGQECTFIHLFKDKQPTPEQEQDLITFREIGQAEFESRVEYDLLRNPSVKPPKRKKRLLTFAERRSRRRKVSEVEKERKLQIECWKKRVAFASTTGTHLPNSFQQCIELPRAIATSDGHPVKGPKSNSTKVYEKRYEHATPKVIMTSLPPSWLPTTVIMEGMFLINITPWSAHKNLGDYADFLIRQKLLPHFRNGATELHLIFDDPECQVQSPKFFERQHRDQTNPVPDDHYCNSFTEDMIIPPKWRENILNCRNCKRNLICFLSNHFLGRMARKLLPNHRFVTAGGFNGAQRNQAWYIERNGTPQHDSRLTCNAEESDTRIWLHALNSAGQHKLVLSPDTDVYHIGLPIIAMTSLHVIVQLSPFSSLELRLLDMRGLICAFANDPDLAKIPQSLSPSAMQVLYTCTGCDFVSFFNGFGKASFLSTMFEYCGFICSGSIQVPGILTDVEPGSQGFLSFVRLVGCAYFRKHKAAFLPSYPTPITLFNSLVKEGQSILVHHITWLDFLRERIWSRIKYEEEMIPSEGALQRHWQRSCWVVSVWRQATQNQIVYPPLDGSGWKQPNSSTLLLDWDSDENIARVRTTVALIKKGCGCKTGCLSSRCKCKKDGSHCGPGCKCLRCCNLPIHINPDTIHIEVDEIENSDSGSDSEDLERDVDDLMTDIFGGHSQSDLEEYDSDHDN